MFTAQDILMAHAKVKSGADYPRYVQDLKAMGVVFYDFVVENGQNNYFDQEGNSVSTPEKYSPLHVADSASSEKLKHNILIHQQGKTDFPTFCKQAAEAGVEKWVSDLKKMVVIYLDKKGNELLAEPIPTGDYV